MPATLEEAKKSRGIQRFQGFQACDWINLAEPPETSGILASKHSVKHIHLQSR
jgi:hypothetical protein